MTKNMKKLIYLIVSISMAVVAVAVLVVASIRTSKYGKNEYSQNLKVKEITLNQERSDNTVRLLCHDVVLDGQIRNDSKIDNLVVNLEVVFAGVNSASGEYMEFVYVKEIRDFNAGTNYDIINEKLTIMSRDGYIPESIKEVRLVSNEVVNIIPFEDTDETNLILFALSLGILFIAGFMFAKWNMLRTQNVQVSVSTQSEVEEVNEENLDDGE